MKKLGWGISVLGLMAMTAEASAGVACDPVSAAALKTAAVQQELMVAGLTCGAGSAYNHFVLADRLDLQKSDADLMAYFKKRDGKEAGYDSYKTKLANLASNKSSAEGSHFCSDTARLFRASEGASLKDFVAGQRLLIAAPEACAVKYDRVEEASVGGPSYALPAAPYGAPPTERRADPQYDAMRRYADADTQRYADSGPSYDRAAQRYDRQDQRQDYRDYYDPPPPPARPARREQDYYLQGWGYGPYAWLPARPRWYGSDY
jgi:hypothetical protein